MGQPHLSPQKYSTRLNMAGIIITIAPVADLPLLRSRPFVIHRHRRHPEDHNSSPTFNIGSNGPSQIKDVAVAVAVSFPHVDFLLQAIRKRLGLGVVRLL